MNPLALMLTSLLWGQAADTSAQSPAGPRYRDLPAANASQIPGSNAKGQTAAEHGLPSLPRSRARGTSRNPGQSGGRAFPARGNGSHIPPASTAVARESGARDRDDESEESTLPAITLPGRAPGDNVGANPFPAPNTGNPLRGRSSGEIPASKNTAAEIPATSGPAGNLASGEAAAEQAIPGAGAAEQSLTTEAAELEEQPRRFVPATRSGSTFVPAVVDERVVPASGVEDGSLVPVQPPENEQPAERLLREAFIPPELHSLSGAPVTLDELLRSQESVGERHATLVRTYWQLCSAVARYHWTLREQRILEQAIAGRQIPRAASAEVLAARARTVEAKAEAVDTQLRLAALRPAVSSEELPLPVDRPVVASYRTYYESIFASRGALEIKARHAKRFHETLPLRREVIQAYAESVDAAEAVAQPNNHLLQQGQLDLLGLASSLEHLHRQRKAFIESVRIYNQSIADYALLAASPGSSASGLLPMLIKVKPREQDSMAEVFTTPQPALSAEIQVGATQELTSEGNTFVRGPAINSPAASVPVSSEASIQSGVIQAGAEVALPESSLPEATSGQKQMRSVLVRSGKRPLEAGR